ncbi:Uncharacterised protein [Mycobacteroides abscessus subsp. massiliense]|nr:Uncharacterised protein [Mycobacteroides abscessus subsp. massiliense]
MHRTAIALLLLAIALSSGGVAAPVASADLVSMSREDCDAWKEPLFVRKDKLEANLSGHAQRIQALRAAMTRHNNRQIDNTNQAAVDAYNSEADQLNAQAAQLDVEADQLNAARDEWSDEFDRFLAQCADYYAPIAPRQPTPPLNSAALIDLAARLVDSPDDQN